MKKMSQLRLRAEIAAQYESTCRPHLFQTQAAYQQILNERFYAGDFHRWKDWSAFVEALKQCNRYRKPIVLMTRPGALFQQSHPTFSTITRAFKKNGLEPFFSTKHLSPAPVTGGIKADIAIILVMPPLAEQRFKLCLQVPPDQIKSTSPGK